LLSFLNIPGNLPAGQFIYVNSTLNLVKRYAENISLAVDNDTSVYCTFGVQQKAIMVIKSALQLDSKATFAECEALNGEAPVQETVPRDSAGLWEAFIDLTTFCSKRVEIGTEMLTAMVPIANVEQIRPPRKGTNPRADEKRLFNTNFANTAEMIGRVIQRLSEFSKEDIHRLCLNSSAFRTLILFSLHGETAIREAATEFLKTLTGESTRSDALLATLRLRFEDALPAYNFAFYQYLKSPHPWGPMQHLLNASRDVLNGLSDPSTGILRADALDTFPKFQAVSGWWIAQWRLVDQSFKHAEHWSHIVEIAMMQEFCREVIELAAGLLAQDGLLVAALERWAKASNAEARHKRQMEVLLGTCQQNCYGLVKMIRLKDEYLVGITVDVLAKLLRRLREYDLMLPANSQQFLESACIPDPVGKFLTPTNLKPRQRAELLKAMRDDDSEVEIVAIRKAEKPKKQSTLDGWPSAPRPSSASTTTTTSSRTNRDDVLELSSTVEKRRSTLEAIAAARQQKSKPPTLPLMRPKLDSKPLLAPTPTSIKESRQRAKEEKMKRDAEAVARARALRGDGGSGTGVVGKEHGPQKSEIMVDSDDEDVDESDDDDHFAGLVNSVDKGRQSVNDAERRRERALLDKSRGPVKKVKQLRSAKDLRARLIPSMDTLHQSILEWDIFHGDNNPPNSVDCKEVSNTYSHAVEYKQTFLPLLLSEAWRSFVTAKDESTSKPFGIRVATRMNVDRFLEMTATMPIAENKDRKLGERDILLLSSAVSPLADPEQPHCLARVWKIKYKKDMIEVTYRLNGKNNALAGDLSPGRDVYAVKITNMTTIEREYAALESLQYYDLCDEIMVAKPSPILNYAPELTDSVMKIYKLNPGQAKAILGARDNDGFTLIQGYVFTLLACN
jgi:senataxin